MISKSSPYDDSEHLLTCNIFSWFVSTVDFHFLGGPFFVFGNKLFGQESKPFMVLHFVRYKIVTMELRISKKVGKQMKKNERMTVNSESIRSMTMLR